MSNDPNVKDVAAPSGIVPLGGVAFQTADGDSVPVEAAHPLPVEQRITAAGSTALAGSTAVTAVIGPFTPQLGRPIWLTLAGTWTGTVTVKRSIDGGTNKRALTAGGAAWASFTANAQEQIVEETESGAAYYLDVTLNSGTLTYRLAQ